MDDSVSVASALVERAARITVKLVDPPTGIALDKEVALKVTEVVLHALRVHPAGAAVVLENSEPAPLRRIRT